MLIERASKPHCFKAFYNGQEALNEIMSHLGNPEKLPELILLDINMPVMNGWDFLDELEKIKKDIPKIPRVSMMTSSSLDNDMARALNYSNVKEFITKPLTMQQLEELTSEF